MLRDLPRAGGAQVQPQFLPGLPAAVLEQEEGQAGVSRLQEEVLPDTAHGESGPEERGRHFPEGAGAQDRRRRVRGWWAGGGGGGGGGEVHDARGSCEALLSG